MKAFVIIILCNFWDSTEIIQWGEEGGCTFKMEPLRNSLEPLLATLFCRSNSKTFEKHKHPSSYISRNCISMQTFAVKKSILTKDHHSDLAKV
ncbi:hypothetical protein V6Z11_D01G112600 [Gossypium hirsutum]